MLKTEAMLRGRTILNIPDRTRTDGVSGASQVGGDDSQLERVASRGGFVVFVALQGERGNANVKVGSVGPFDTKRPPKDKIKLVAEHKKRPRNEEEVMMRTLTTCVHWGLVETHGCCTERQAVL